jgi:hypothetical protein
MQSTKVDVAVIGAGSAGLAAFHSARAAGKRALLVESGDLEALCARSGCMPSKLLIAAANGLHDARALGARGITGLEHAKPVVATHADSDCPGSHLLPPHAPVLQMALISLRFTRREVPAFERKNTLWRKASRMNLPGFLALRFTQFAAVFCPTERHTRQFFPCEHSSLCLLAASEWPAELVCGA